MGTKVRIIGIVTGLIVAWYLAKLWNSGGAFTSDSDPWTLNYQGQRVRLTHPSETYGEYKDDPNNIAPEENARVAKLVAEAPIARRFATREEAIHAVFALEFPGYGLGTFGERPQPEGSVLCMAFIEIPRAHRDRYLVFRGTREGYALIDDFVVSSEPRIEQIREKDGKLAYYDAAGKLIVTHPLAGNSK